MLAIDRMAGGTLGVHPSTPLGMVMAGNALTPVSALPRDRQAKYALRILSRPDGQLEDRILCSNTEIGHRLQKAIDWEDNIVENSRCYQI